MLFTGGLMKEAVMKITNESNRIPTKPSNIKMSHTTWNYVYSGLMRTLVKNELHPFMVQSIATAWQVFHRAISERQINIHLVYANHCQCGATDPCAHAFCDGLNDNHIETALKAMFKA